MLTALTETGKSDDLALVTRCLDGDADAWRELIVRYERLIYSVALRYFDDPGDAADIFQEVAIELYRGLDSIRDAQAIPAWLVTVTRRKCHAADRTLARSRTIDEESAVAVERESLAFVRRFWIEEAVERLPERCRRLVRALYLESDQPTYSEVARRFEMPVASIGPTRARCLKKLRKLVEGK